MISRLLLPSAMRLATYSCVRRSRRIRARQIMYSARLASRFPPRLRRCRTTLPEKASMGETPHRLAKEASLLNLWGLSLRPRSAAWRHGRCRCPATRPTPGRLAPPADRGASLAQRSLPRGPRNGEPPNGARTWSPPVRVTRVICDAEACGHRDELLRRESAQTVEEFIRCRHAQALELVGGLRPGLHRGATSCPQGPDHLHAAVSALRHTRRFAGLLPARAALSASEGSDFLKLWRELRRRRFWRSTSSTSIPLVLRWRTSPAP